MYLPKIKYLKVNLKIICFENPTNVSCIVLSTYLCVEGIENVIFARLLNNYTLLGNILDCKIAILHEHFEEIKINDDVS
jgi:hypothetical protein